MKRPSALGWRAPPPPRRPVPQNQGRQDNKTFLELRANPSGKPCFSGTWDVGGGHPEILRETVARANKCDVSSDVVVYTMFNGKNEGRQALVYRAPLDVIFVQIRIAKRPPARVASINYSALHETTSTGTP